jgi:hypothetical protein
VALGALEMLTGCTVDLDLKILIEIFDVFVHEFSPMKWLAI